MNWRQVSPPGSRSVLLGELDLDSADEARDSAFLSPEEIERAGRFRRRQDARRFVAARAWMRRGLGELLGVAPGRILLAAGPFGKPEILDSPVPLSFSLAHAGARALLAVAEDATVGVDLEARGAAPDAEVLAPVALAPDELAEFHSLPARECEPFFLARWTAKEALLKAAGLGLSREPAGISLVPDAGGALVPRGEPRLSGLRAHLLDVGPLFIAALATEGNPLSRRERAGVRGVPQRSIGDESRSPAIGL
jgi:4'-phosphopantetheinyl transferase